MNNIILNLTDNSRAAYEPLTYYAEYPKFFSLHSHHLMEMQSPSVTPNGYLWQQELARMIDNTLLEVSWDELDRIEIDRNAEKMHRKAALIELLRAWREGDEQEQRDTWEYLKQALDEDRLSDRKLFP